MSDRPPMPTYKIEDLGDRLVLSVPSQKRLGSLLVLGLFSLLWLLLGVLYFAFLIMVSSFNLSDELNSTFLIVYICIGYPFIYPLFWQIFGKEEIQITNQFIKIRRVILGFGRSREYPANQMGVFHLSYKVVKRLKVTGCA